MASPFGGRSIGGPAGERNGATRAAAAAESTLPARPSARRFLSLDDNETGRPRKRER
jgi:hypothetical protein